MIKRNFQLNDLPEQYFYHLLKIEGGYVDDKDDRGGKTNYGLSTVFINTVGQKYGIKDVKEITEIKAYEIYNEEFWKKYKCYEYPKPLDFLIFDCFVNHGQQGGKSRLKELLDRLQLHYQTKQLIDDKNKLQNLDYEYLKNKVIEISKNLLPSPIIADILLLVRMDFYYDFVNKNPSQQKFFKGWIRRLKVIMDEILTLKDKG